MLKKIFYLIVCVSFSLPMTAAAETLYALDPFGVLYSVDETVAAPGPCGTKVREALLPNGASYSSFTDLVWVNGYFYASYDSGKIVRFGLTTGDETVLGNTGLPINAMTKDPQGQVYIGYDRYIAKLNLNTLAVTDQRTIGTEFYNIEHPPIYPQALAWKNGNLLVLASGTPSGSTYPTDVTAGTYSVNPLTGLLVSALCTQGNYSYPCIYLSGNYLSLAVRPSNNSNVTFRHGWLGSGLLDSSRVHFQFDPTDPPTYPELYPSLQPYNSCSGLTDEQCRRVRPPVVGLTYDNLTPTPIPTPTPVRMGLAPKLCAMGVICPTPTPTP